MNDSQLKKFDRARILIKNGKAHAAATILAKLNDEVDEFRINRALVAANLADHQYMAARRLAEERVSDYLKEKSDAQLLIRVELADQQFMTARRQIAKLPQWSVQLMPLVKDAEENALATMNTSLRERWREFYHLGDTSFKEQQRRMSVANRLPLSYYLKGAMFLLRDPFTNPLIRASLLENLQPLKIQQNVKVYWIDEQEHDLNLADLQAIDSMGVVQQLRQQIADKYANQDPVSLQTAQRELNLQLIYLYPFIDVAVTDPNSWVTALTSSGQLVKPNHSVEKALDWQRKINRLVTRISH
ncbi:hypothetical protein [Limosilactobacillus sp.]|uniref:hypothetical protein n=1 Tax=Limosilactobacillus sp. TaxID=2773925 RepID=UPI00345EF5F3